MRKFQKKEGKKQNSKKEANNTKYLACYPTTLSTFNPHNFEAGISGLHLYFVCKENET